MAFEQDDIHSPPYPSMICTSASLYRALHELKQWTVAMINQMEEHPLRSRMKGLERLKYPDALPGEGVFEIISVVDKYVGLMCVRRIRETWDAILREHEQDWDNRICVQQRIFLIGDACDTLRDAFIDPETREAKHFENFQQVVGYLDEMKQHFASFFAPPEMRDDLEPPD